LKGLQNKQPKSANPTSQDEEHAQQVSIDATRSLQALETSKKENLKLLLRNGRALKMDINYQDIKLEAKIVSQPEKVHRGLWSLPFIIWGFRIFTKST
jgi:hypothetical protein